MNYQCFFVEPTGRQRVGLRRYRCSDDEPKCPGEMSYHNAVLWIGERAIVKKPDGDQEPIPDAEKEELLKDPRMPLSCSCGYVFTEEDKRQVFTEEIYRRTDTGVELSLNDAPPGAMWYADWITWEQGPDGRNLIVRMPGRHDWRVDGRCSNCDSLCKHCSQPYHAHDHKTCPNKNYEDARPHKCWNRSGVPPLITVGKAGGPTCGAGAGSILVPGWHGFLENGVLREC